MTSIGSEEISLLLALLEAKVLRFTNTTLVDVHDACGRALIDAGLMAATGTEGIAVDCEGSPCEVIFDPNRGEYGTTIH